MLQSVAVTSYVAIAASFTFSQSAVALTGADQATPELLDLIRAHCTAWEAFGESCNAADSMHPTYGGPQAEAIHAVRNDAEQDALRLVLECPVLTLADAQAKAWHLLNEDYGLEPHDLKELLVSIANGPLTADVGATRKSASGQEAAADEPLIDAIEAYHAGLAAFNATPSAVTELDEEGAIAWTYGPPMKVLMEWDKPAQTIAEAIAAIGMADEENISFTGSVIAENMVKAALDYFSPRRSRLPASPKQDTKIVALFQDWKRVREENDCCNTGEEAQAMYRVYAALQEEITSLSPTSARDLAAQLVVETDFGDSDYREVFFERVARLAEKV